MGILIDSSVFIAAERGRLSLAEHVPGQEQEPVAISALTASELLHGVHRAADPRRRTQRERFVEGILAQFLVVEFGLEAACTRGCGQICWPAGKQWGHTT